METAKIDWSAASRVDETQKSTAYAIACGDGREDLFRRDRKYRRRNFQRVKLDQRIQI
jgi:hypothetical protein